MIYKNDPTSPTKFAIVSTEEGTAQAEREIFGILRFDVFDNEKARLDISERGFVNLSKKEARLLAEALLEWVRKCRFCGDLLPSNVLTGRPPRFCGPKCARLAREEKKLYARHRELAKKEVFGTIDVFEKEELEALRKELDALDL